MGTHGVGPPSHPEGAGQALPADFGAQGAAQVKPAPPTAPPGPTRVAGALARGCTLHDGAPGHINQIKFTDPVLCAHHAGNIV